MRTSRAPGSSPARSSSAACPWTRSRCTSTSIPARSDAYGQTAGMLAGVPVRLSTKHGFNEFREGRVFALGDRAIGAMAHRQIAISRGLARYLAETEGFPEPDFEIVHYGIAAGAEPAPYKGKEPRFLCV